MSEDRRDIVEVLRSELAFIEQGGYQGPMRTPWKPTSIFLDSPACINFKDPQRSRPCVECLLTDFVPIKSLCEKVPCHHIPLNAHGETIYTMERQYAPDELESAVRNWLRATIERLEQDRAGSPPAQRLNA